MDDRFPFRARVTAVIALAALLWACCSCAKSRKSQNGAGEGAQETATSDRLGQDEVKLYLELMRAAAARVNNLRPADKAALGRMRKMQDDVEAGRIPTPMEGDPEAEVIARGMSIQQALDLVIAEEKGMDIDHYAAVRDLIESIVNPSGIVPEEGDEGLGKPITPYQAEIRLANKKLLAPYAPEIEQLYQVVRKTLAEKPIR